MLEEGALLRLANVYFHRERALPPDMAQIHRLTQARTLQERRAVEAVLGERFELLEDGWHEHTFDEQIADFKANSANARKAAHAMHSKRRSKVSITDADAVHPHSERTANQKPETTNSETTNPETNTLHSQPKAECAGGRSRRVAGPGYPDGFIKFWNAAPRRKNLHKDETYAAYAEALATLREEGVADPDQHLLHRIEAYARECILHGTETIYIKLAKNWLAERRWTDEYSVDVETG